MPVTPGVWVPEFTAPSMKKANTDTAGAYLPLVVAGTTVQFETITVPAASGARAVFGGSASLNHAVVADAQFCVILSAGVTTTPIVFNGAALKIKRL